MSYAEYNTTVYYNVDAGELGSHDLEYETTIEVEDSWMVDQVVDQDLLDDDQKETIAKEWLSEQDEDTLLELFAEMCDITV